MKKIEDLLEMLATYGGKIVSSNNLTPYQIREAEAGKRMYVNEYGLGFVWMPHIKRLPETSEEIMLLLSWFPLELKKERAG